MADGVNNATTAARLMPPSRGKGRLKPAAAREKIGVSRAEATPTSDEEESSGAGGWVSPIVEQAYSGSTFYQHVDSSGLFTLEFGDTWTGIDDDGNGDTYIIKNDDPATP